MATRNPVRVLPVPVGEATSTSPPAAMSGHAASWGPVGPPGNCWANQARTAGWKDSRMLTSPIPPDRCARPYGRPAGPPQPAPGMAPWRAPSKHGGHLGPPGLDHLGGLGEVPVVGRRIAPR